MDLGTAGPLVLETLTKACSQSAEVLTPAEHQLHQWETQPGFYNILSVSSEARGTAEGDFSGQFFHIFSSPEPKAHDELIEYQSSRRPSVRPHF